MGAAAFAALPIRDSSAGQFTGRIRKALKYHMVTEDLSIEDKFRLVKDIGYDGIEIRTIDKVDPAEVDRAIEKTGLPVHGVIHSSNPDIPPAIDLAKRWGGTSVLVVARYDKALSLEKNWNRDRDNYRKASDYAEAQDIDILVENVWASYLISAFDLRNFLDDVDSPRVRSYFDIGNNMRWGVSQHWVKHLGKRIAKLDVKEYNTDLQMNEGARAAFRSELGEGSIEWAEVRKELAAIEYEGWATAEMKGGDRKRLTDIADRMNKVLDL